ncbi:MULTISPECIES: type I-F CRISPR-associated protein Csy2 [Acinetobacter]|uniref:Crispr-associated protein, Csy2 family protein n=5 Tax=Acinetobacter baumannii TaxID=470 RepID=A0A0D5YEV7_ACIBA|nr:MULTISPECIES: type I-F CRISPR-associated protein Csy2 [Acinetobacter]EMT98186.1 CRISPR-associated protein (Cas_Csy2) family protein [Acinetobacter baumannii ABNIH6]PXA51913.1 type I-F CRISPR-associated protein Csy2 [Acinetobacter baumannii A424]ACJ42248.2 type I-F CRISPR-associated protein Csy2 [Acinetobacter baumannii AB0057]AJF82615.1 CRISPR-associated protein (Cas_Csy2) family protein [Acinetobacter baumannii]AKA30842.1 crispr-associated protein, Csy2 family protein [Acinetobacter bauman
MRHFLLIPHLKLHNANAMSSPYTIGFPAMTAWLGAVHALQRKLQTKDCDVALTKVAVSCHEFNLQTYKGQGDFVHSIIGTANPLDKDGSRPAFIEEARCHLEVSLLIEIENLGIKKREQLLKIVPDFVSSMKFASGDVLSVQKCQIIDFDEDESHDKELRPILNKLMLGHVLIERRDLVVESMNQGRDALDAVLDYLKVTHSSAVDENGKVTWNSKRQTHGWLVPIAIGFQGISELGQAKNQRDANTPHRFAESVLTLGEFVMPYRIEHIDQLLWQYHVDLENNLYLCKNISTI